MVWMVRSGCNEVPNIVFGKRRQRLPISSEKSIFSLQGSKTPVGPASCSEKQPDQFALHAVRKGDLAAGFGKDEFCNLGEPLAGGAEGIQADGVGGGDAVGAGQADEFGLSG